MLPIDEMLSDLRGCIEHFEDFKSDENFDVVQKELRRIERECESLIDGN